MHAPPISNAATAVEALLDWWSLAGVETWVGEDPVDWTAARTAARQQVASIAPASAPQTAKEWPDDWDSFHTWLVRGQDMPESTWTGAVAAPTGPTAPPLMVVLDMPTDSTGRLLTPEVERLLKDMLRAMGLSQEGVHIASLAVRRPPGGLLPADSVGALAERMRHHIALIRPEALLIMGDGTNRALAPTNGGEEGQYSQSVNHRTGNVKAVATFHPQLIMSQAAAKSECWRALQSLIGGK